jgi:hypothetical protein
MLQTPCTLPGKDWVAGMCPSPVIAMINFDSYPGSFTPQTVPHTFLAKREKFIAKRPIR